jgi:hypothetical protein
MNVEAGGDVELVGCDGNRGEEGLMEERGTIWLQRRRHSNSI